MAAQIRLPEALSRLGRWSNCLCGPWTYPVAIVIAGSPDRSSQSPLDPLEPRVFFGIVILLHSYAGLESAVDIASQELYYFYGLDLHDCIAL
jgi:hypothetical protein